MLVVQIDVVCTETLEGAVEGELDVGRRADRLSTAKLAFWVAPAELRGKEDVGAPSGVVEPLPKREFSW